MGRGDVNVRKLRYLRRRKPVRLTEGLTNGVKIQANHERPFATLERCESIASTCLVTSGNSRPPIQPVCMYPIQVQILPVQVESSDGAIEGRADDDKAAGGEGDLGDTAGVLGESHKAQATAGVPYLHLPIGNHISAQPHTCFC